MVLASAGASEVRALFDIGAGFERTETGGWSLSREAAHSVARVARMKGDQAGAGILAALITAVREADHIEIRDGWRAEALLPDQARGCAGVLARDPEANCIRSKQAIPSSPPAPLVDSMRSPPPPGPARGRPW